MRFVWFWTFWYWSKESFRSGSLLRGPLDGIGGHWDEWFRHEASEEDRRAIQEVGQTEYAQYQFVTWLHAHWAREAGWGRNRPVPRFVLRQLAKLAPFDTWPALDEYRKSRPGRGVAAIVLAEDSLGEREDVRPMEALALPLDSEIDPPSIVPEGFKVDESELNTTFSAVRSLLCGKGLLVFLALWIVAGRRPYPRPVRIALGLGWLGVGGLFIYLLIGPEPGRLLPLLAGLAGAWGCLVVAFLCVAAKQSFDAWRQGRRLSGVLRKSRVRLRMDAALTIKGGSAGLPFCLNTLGSLHGAQPKEARRSWLWRRFFRKLRTEAGTWAATGVVTAAARIKPVVVGPKLRACLKHPGVERILTPRQSGAGRRAIGRLAGSLAPVAHGPGDLTDLPLRARECLGFAAERPRLRGHSCSHVAQSIMAVGGFTSRWQMVLTSFAVLVSCAMLAALPDLWCILQPPAAPAIVGPSSPSPYHLWVNLDTRYPQCFLAVLESDFWSNRRAEVVSYKGVRSGGRAEIRLNRLARPSSHDEEDGTVWVERRRQFLTREFAPGERVGRYSFAYLNHLGQE